MPLLTTVVLLFLGRQEKEGLHQGGPVGQVITACTVQPARDSAAQQRQRSLKKTVQPNRDSAA
jgi:hypothetical protein